MLMGLVCHREKDNNIVFDNSKDKDETWNIFEITHLLSELVSKIAVFEYLDVAAALNKSIEEGNDAESIITLAKQLETLSAYKPETSSAIPMSRHELRKSVNTFIKEHGFLFSVKMLEDLQLKVEKL